ncbi:MAG: hypothetical protein ABI658_28945 [Acidimicrobiales bacterium]
MVIDGDLGLDAVLFVLVALVAGSVVSAVVIGVGCARSGRRRLGCASLLMAWALTVSVGTMLVVVWRAKDGEATRYDWLWAGAMMGLGWTTAGRLWRRPPMKHSDTI